MPAEPGPTAADAPRAPFARWARSGPWIAAGCGLLLAAGAALVVTPTLGAPADVSTDLALGGPSSEAQVASDLPGSPSLVSEVTVETAQPTQAPPAAGTGAGTSAGTGAGGASGAASLPSAVVDLTNAERAAAGCPPVAFDARLTAAAQLHSEDMVAQDYFSHQSLDGRSPWDRAKAQRYPNPGAENIAKGQASAEDVMRAWMDSPGHRANILNCDLREIGVGVADRTWTQVFGWG